MELYQWDKVRKEVLSPTFARQMINGETMTVARVYLNKGCLVPEHSHHNEQISIVEQGALLFVVAGEKIVVKAGEVLRIPPNVPHSAYAEDEDCVGIDIFCPVREDWVRGDDAYLRR